MDNVQLCYVLNLGRCQCRHVGTRIVNPSHRIVLVWISALRTEVVAHLTEPVGDKPYQPPHWVISEWEWSWC